MRPLRRKRAARRDPRGSWAKTAVLRPPRGRRRGESTISRVAGALAVRRRPVFFLTSSLLLLAVLFGLFAGGHVANAYGTFSRAVGDAFGKIGFAVSEVSVRGNERTPTGAILAGVGAKKGKSIFALDPALVRARLLTLPWVAGADVRRRFPGTVSVVIVEKRPFALWRNGTDVALVERSGAVITRNGLDEFAHLPLIYGKGAPEAAAPLLDAIGASRAVSARFRAAEYVSERRWNLVLDGNVVVRLPEEGWQREIGELERLIVDRGVLERAIEMIDLRYPDSYIFRLHDGDSRPVPRERPT
ncbi:MAG: cell division protein FtsQ/DivIB [Alphaproteobacteria bacterium]